jgi:DNA-binding Xre family transcriptional regulator
MKENKQLTVRLRIKSVLKSKGLKNKDLMPVLDTDRNQTVSDIVNNRRAVSLARLKKIAEFLETEVHELIELGEGFEHLYNEKKEWRGIMPKCKKE